MTPPYFSPNADVLPPGFQDPDGYWTSFYMNPMAVAVNLPWLQRTGAPMPETWEDLLDPAFRNQIQMPTPQSSGTAYNLVASLVLAWGEDEAFDYLKKLARTSRRTRRAVPPRLVPSPWVRSALVSSSARLCSS